MNSTVQAGCNSRKPTIDIRHDDLTPCGRPGQWKCNCPVCHDGVLLVTRDNEKYRLQEIDNCILCGQHFRYTDIKEMRVKDGDPDPNG